MTQFPAPDADAALAAPSPQKSHLHHWLILITAGFAWGMTFSFGKIASESGIHPFALSFWQAFLTLWLVLAYIALRQWRIPMSRAHLAFYFYCGMLGTALPSILFFYAAKHIPAGVASISVATVPMLTFLCAVIIRYEQFAVSRMLGVILGMIAVVLIIAPETSLPDAAAAPWVIVAVAAAMCYALESLYIALKMPQDTNPLVILCGMMACTSVVTAGLSIGVGASLKPAYPLTQVEWSVIAMAAVNVFAYGAYIYLVKSTGAVFASQIAYVVTLSGVLWGIIFFSEQHSGWIWTAMMLMITGLALVKPRDAT